MTSDEYIYWSDLFLTTGSKTPLWYVHFDHANLRTLIKAMPYHQFLKTTYWQIIAELVKDCAGYKCVMCDSSERLEAHHRHYHFHGAEHFNLEKLTCVCRVCHGRHHTKN